MPVRSWVLNLVFFALLVAAAIPLGRFLTRVFAGEARTSERVLGPVERLIYRAARADVGVAMNTGTQAAKEAGNMVDLDSDPTKLIEVVEIGKQLLMTRGSLTTFSVANDIAKYFSILPAIFTGLAAFQTVKGAP
jgi:hypothetical protein